MKNLITILTITFSLFAFSATAQAQNLQQIEIVNAPANFSKVKFAKMLKCNGLSTNHLQQAGIKNMINSLSFQNGKWICIASPQTQQLITSLTNGRIKIINNMMSGSEVCTPV